jgi:hypothetical protein
VRVDEKKRLHQTTAGVGIKMSIDESATAHIMDVLTKLYANPLLAVIREYSTNAWDSHKQAGVDEPIAVTLPSALAPTLTIRDHGIGLDADDIENIYSRYGTSTKRDSNEAVGMLGLGCKSALSYTSQFTLEGRKDGTKVAVLISRDEDGAGSMTPVGIEDTDEPNGVTVHVPIKASDVSTATGLAYEFFRFWPEGEVLVNGETPDESHKLDGIWLTDRILLTQDVRHDLVVMGNVPYPLVEGTAPLFQHHAWSAVCYVDIGDVNFAPSRENLMTTRRTTARLDALRKEVEAEFEKSIQDQITNAKTAKEAQELLVKGRSMGFKGKAIFKGREVVLKLTRKTPTKMEKDYRGVDVEVPQWYGGPDEWSVEQALKYSYLHTNERYYSRKSGDRTQSIDLTAEGQHIFTGFDGKAMTNVKRAKLELWFQQNAPDATTKTYDGFSLPHCVFVDELTSDEKFWTKGWAVHDWADVQAIELPKAVTADGTTTRLKGSYDALIRGRRCEGVPAATILDEAKTTSLYWVQGNLWSGSGHRAFKSGALAESASILVCLGANRIDKFCRDFPAAKRLDDAAREAAERWVKQQDNETRKAYSVQRRCNVDLLKKLTAADLDDPELQKLHALASKNVATYTANRQTFAAWVNDDGDGKAEAWADKLLASYPLYNSIGRYDVPDKKHVVLYLNAVYNARQKGGI